MSFFGFSEKVAICTGDVFLLLTFWLFVGGVPEWRVGEVIGSPTPTLPE